MPEISSMDSPDSAIGTLTDNSPDKESNCDKGNIESVDSGLDEVLPLTEQKVGSAEEDMGINAEVLSATMKVDFNESGSSSNSSPENQEKSSTVESQEILPLVNAEKLETLPETVSQLTNDAGSRIYLVGTAHFSKESQDDVIKTIQMVKPDIVVLELCKARRGVLILDEERILNESKSLDFTKIRLILNQHGNITGILYLLLLSVSVHITKQLKMAPGGEFRVAFHEARRSVPGCLIHLGDRPIEITLARALSSLSVWQKVKLMWHILASKGPISKEEVEKCKKKDFIEEMLAEMTGQFPGISEVFVKERDIYLTRSLQLASDPAIYLNSPPAKSPLVVVGVVGIGHVAGIMELWDKVTEEDVMAIMKIPPPKLSDKIIKCTIKYTFYGLITYGVYKCCPAILKRTLQSSLDAVCDNVLNSYNKVFSK